MTEKPMEKPGENALQAMADLKKSASLFKVPKISPQTKIKDNMKILTEEQYLEELGHIIQKDFFPDLIKLKAQNEYLDAMERNDVLKLREIYANYSGNNPSGSIGAESPATFETPLIKPNPTPGSVSSLSRRNNHHGYSVASTASNSSKPKKISDGHTLDSFLSHYTSEDNQSFEAIIEQADTKLRKKFEVLYDAEGIQQEKMEMALALPTIECQFRAIDGAKTVDTWTYRNKNYIMYIPDGVDFTVTEKLEMAKRKKEISYSNTRLRHNPFDDQQSKITITELAKSQAKGLSGKIGVDGNVLKSGNPLAATSSNGLSYLDTPSATPGNITDSPFMTWGEIEGTPFRLDGSDTPVRPQAGPSFHIAETSRRENIALNLADKASERVRNQKSKAINAARQNIAASPYVRSTLSRLASMSPAAKQLAASKLSKNDGLMGTPTTNSTNSFSAYHRLPTTPNFTTKRLISKGQIRKITTPSPLVRHKVSNQLSLQRSKHSIEIRDSQHISLTPSSSGSVNVTEQQLTDDLLNIPTKRIKAADFF